MEKKLVFSVITADYDSVQTIPDSLIKRDIKFVLFSDRPLNPANGWEIIYINHLNKIPKNLNPTALSRWLKFNVHKLILGYEKCIYIDGNVSPALWLEDIFSLLNNYDCVFLEHPFRRNILQELIICMLYNKISVTVACKVFKKLVYSAPAYDDYRLTANRVIGRNLQSNHADKLHERVFLMYKSGVFRDQLITPFIFHRKSDVSVFIAKYPSSDKLKVHEHNKHSRRGYLGLKYILLKILYASTLLASYISIRAIRFVIKGYKFFKNI